MDLDKKFYKGFKKNFKILVDTREKKNNHITDYFNKNGINYKNKKLDSGDYSFEIDELNFQSSLIIERKSSLDELCGNFTAHRDRFEREFKRIPKDFFIILLIENSNLNDIINHNYNSKMHPNSLLGSLRSWRKKYSIHTIFLQNKKEVGKFIYEKTISYIEKYIINEEFLKTMNNNIKKFEIEQMKFI